MPIYVIISLDVEEEGLFRSKYATHVNEVRNVAYLKNLAPLLGRGIKPTLFCAYPVFKDKNAWTILENLRDNHGAEIGAHLHFWNTPPLKSSADVLNAVPTCNLESDLLTVKLETLFNAGHDFQGSPVKSFRMGRWDLHKRHWPFLFDAGIEVDSSIRPMFASTTPQNGADHFNAPNQPYWVENKGKRILEVPLSVAPISRLFMEIHKKPQNELGKQARFFMRYWNTISLLPVYYPLWALKLATRIILAKGNVLLMTWHSSEMMPGGAPHLPDAGVIKKMLNKVDTWIDWLQKHWDVHFITLSELAAIQNRTGNQLMPVGSGDWHP